MAPLILLHYIYTVHCKCTALVPINSVSYVAIVIKKLHPKEGLEKGLERCWIAAKSTSLLSSGS
jgi:hypothetical protein